jgi:hypothetical protein
MFAVQGAAYAQGQQVEPAHAPKTVSNLLSQANEVELALSAGPEHLRVEATVYVFGDDGYARVNRDVDAGFNEGRYSSLHKAGIAY